MKHCLLLLGFLLAGCSTLPPARQISRARFFALQYESATGGNGWRYMGQIAGKEWLYRYAIPGGQSDIGQRVVVDRVWCDPTEAVPVRPLDLDNPPP